MCGSEEDGRPPDVAHRTFPHPRALGGHRRRGRRLGHGHRPPGLAGPPAPAGDHRLPGGRGAGRGAPRRRAAPPRPARPHPLAGGQHGGRGHPGLHQGARDRRRRLPGQRQGSRRPGAGPGLLPPRAVRRARRHHLRGAHAHPRSWSRASTRRRLARWPPTSARSASPSPTRARGSATPASGSCARPERRRSDGRDLQPPARPAHPAALAGPSQGRRGPPSARAWP